MFSRRRRPSFRYKVTPAVCTDADLLVVVPWALSEVVSGTPKVFAPFVVGAKYAAEYKNWYWAHQRTGSGERGVILSNVTQNYPAKSDMISDKPRSDSGGNFGRLARTGLLDAYIGDLFNERLVGIPLSSWQRFLSIFTESRSLSEIRAEVEKLASSISQTQSNQAEVKARVFEKFQEILDLLDTD